MLSIILSIILALFILSVSIACPILIRPIFYVQVESLHLPEISGFSAETIMEAYDDVMDYCTGGGEHAGKTFSTGTLAWSEEGKGHFDDVERLFRTLTVFLFGFITCFSRERKTGCWIPTQTRSF